MRRHVQQPAAVVEVFAGVWPLLQAALGLYGREPRPAERLCKVRHLDAVAGVMLSMAFRECQISPFVGNAACANTGRSDPTRVLQQKFVSTGLIWAVG